MCADYVPDVRTSLWSLWCHNTDFCGSNVGSRLFLRQKLAILVRAQILAPTRGEKIAFFAYCLLHQNPTFSKQTLQGATGARFCRILDREEALESLNAEL